MARIVELTVSQTHTVRTPLGHLCAFVMMDSMVMALINVMTMMNVQIEVIRVQIMPFALTPKAGVT